MNKRGIAVVVLLIVSVVVMIYKAETSYQHLAAATKWARSFGYGFSPWVIGLAVAAIKEGWAGIRDLECDVRLHLDLFAKASEATEDRHRLRPAVGIFPGEFLDRLWIRLGGHKGRQDVMERFSAIGP